MGIGHKFVYIFSLGRESEGLKFLEGNLVQSVVTEVFGFLFLCQREPVLEETDLGGEELGAVRVTLV